MESRNHPSFALVRLRNLNLNFCFPFTHLVADLESRRYICWLSGSRSFSRNSYTTNPVFLMSVINVSLYELRIEL